MQHAPHVVPTVRVTLLEPELKFLTLLQPPLIPRAARREAPVRSERAPVLPDVGTGGALEDGAVGQDIDPRTKR